MKTKIILSATLVACGLVRAETGADLEIEFLNRYVDLGGDIEPGSRFLRAAGGTELHGLDLGLEAFQALGSGEYNEISLGISRDFDFGGMTLTPGFTWLWFPEDGEDSAEVTLGVELPLAGALEFFGEAAYDVMESEGFLELGLALPQSVPVNGLDVEITPSVTFGFDYGMVSGDRSFKENQVVAALEASVPVHEQVDLFASVNHSFALGALEDAGEGDVSWFGLGIAVGF